LYSLSELNRNGMPRLLDGITTKNDWERKLDHIRRVWLDYIGELPPRVPANVRVLSQLTLDDHIRQHIVYDTVYGDRITAFLLIPSTNGEMPNSAARYPAVLALHPTNRNGKEDIATYPGKKDRTYAIELVQRGYVVLAPDALTAGERIYPGHEPFQSGPFYEQYPEWTTVAKNMTDHMHGIDVLVGLAYVNAEAIGAIGHSFGSYNAYFLAGFDKRVKAIAASCGVSPFTRDPHPEHWGVRADWYTHIPKMTPELTQGHVPFEFHEIIALCCPTPYFNYSAQGDQIFPHWKSIGDAMFELATLYDWHGAGDRFVSMLGSGPHDFPPLVRQMAYSFLDRWLK